MRYHPLQEVAKLLAGLAAADFFWMLWFSQQHLRSMQFFGATFTQDMVLPAILFDVALFLMLVHYGWNIGQIPRMRERSYMLVAGVLFTVVAVVHLWRLFTGSDLVIADWEVPLWLSWFGVVLAAYLAYSSFHFAARVKR